MKKIIYSLFVCLTLFLGSCSDKTSFDDSKITYFVTFALSGDQTMLVPVGTAYVDPGVKATEGAKDVSSTMKIAGAVNSNSIGLYPVTYSAVNSDGFQSSAIRTVIVYDPNVTTDISGKYLLETGSYRLTKSTGAHTAFSGYSVTLTYIAPGIFHVSDFFAGYYEYRAAYGSSAAMSGYVKLNPDNTLGLLSSFVATWGNSLDSLDNATYNPTTNKIHWDASWEKAYTWVLDLTKQ